MTEFHHKRPTRKLTSKERSLKLKFHRLLSVVDESLKNIEITKLQFHIELLLTDEEEDRPQLITVLQYIKEVKEQKTSKDLLVYLKANKFISYRNPQLLEDIVNVLLSHDVGVVSQMNQYIKDCEEFKLTLDELHQISREGLGPRAPSGLQEFSFKVNGDYSFPQWQKIYAEIFLWSNHTLLKSVNPGCVIMTYVALPCVVSTVMKDLSDPVFLEKLKSKGVTVVQPELGQTHSEVSVSSILCLLFTCTHSHHTLVAS